MLNYIKLRQFLILFICLFVFIGAKGQNQVSGKVVSATDGLGLPGVNVVIKGTTVGVATNADGNYVLKMPEGNAEIEFSAIGMKPVVIAYTGGNQTINVTMYEELSELDEVVVVGYGTQARSQMSTSVSKLDTKTLQSAPRTNAATALQGSIAGLSVQNTTGNPGSTPKIVLRGGTDWEGKGSPLILVDGIISSFYALNTEDIQSIEVLKDAASTAIYGARAANGVVLITTKQGKEGKSSINYKFKFGVNRRRAGYDYLNAHDYIYYNRKAVKNYTEVTGRTNFDAGFLNGRSGGFGIGNNTTDSPFTTMVLDDTNRYLLNQKGWYQMEDPINPGQQLIYMDNKMNELFYQDSNVKDHYLSFDGGNDKGTYSLGLGYMDD